jgi:deazaflavin-dependent oxidoreductase (nitroreductase family)
MPPTSKPRKLPRGLKPANRVVVAMQRLGVSFGPMGLLSVPGRKSGRMRNTPVSPLTVEGRRYLVAVFDGADWVKNARAAGWGILARGRKQERMLIVELSVEERASVLREFPDKETRAARFLR